MLLVRSSGEEVTGRLADEGESDSKIVRPKPDIPHIGLFFKTATSGTGDKLSFRNAAELTPKMNFVARSTTRKLVSLLQTWGHRLPKSYASIAVAFYLGF